MSITFNTNVTINSNAVDFATEMLRFIFPDILEWFNNYNKKIKQPFRDLVRNIINTSTEYQEMITNPEIFGSLGVVKLQNKLDKIIDRLVNNLLMTMETPRIINGKLTGNSTILLIKDDYSEILSMSEASFQSEGGYLIEWLRWVLIEHSNTVIKNYHFSLDVGRGRTGVGFMKHGGFWSVPFQITGKRSDNFITRAIDNSNEAILDLMEDVLSKS